MRQVRIMLEPKTILIKRSQILMITKQNFKENKITTKNLRELLHLKKETLQRLEKFYLDQI